MVFMLTPVSILRMENRMKNKILIFMILASSTSIDARKTIAISKDDPHTFSIVSHLKRKPIRVHRQNEDYIKIGCKPTDSFKHDRFIHSCTIKVKSGAPEGTFALFRKTLENGWKSLFYISIKQ